MGWKCHWKKKVSHKRNVVSKFWDIPLREPNKLFRNATEGWTWYLVLKCQKHLEQRRLGWTVKPVQQNVGRKFSWIRARHRREFGEASAPPPQCHQWASRPTGGETWTRCQSLLSNPWHQESATFSAFSLYFSCCCTRTLLCSAVCVVRFSQKTSFPHTSTYLGPYLKLFWISPNTNSLHISSFYPYRTALRLYMRVQRNFAFLKNELGIHQVKIMWNLG
jgi:hypothetical protein